MKVVIQRVKSASVTVEKNVIGCIEKGLLILLGMCLEDHSGKLLSLVEKLIHLRIFSDEAGKMNRSVKEIDGSILVISQFTLYGDCCAGRRPSFTKTLSPDQAKPLYDQFIHQLQQHLGDEKVQSGQFGEHMEVKLINDGPVTFILES